MGASIAVGNRLITRHLLSGRVPVQWPDAEVVDAGPAPAPSTGELAADPFAHQGAVDAVKRMGSSLRRSSPA